MILFKNKNNTDMNLNREVQKYWVILKTLKKYKIM